MTTEILGFIIIVGAIIVLLARRQLQKVEEDPVLFRDYIQQRTTFTGIRVVRLNMKH